MATNENAGRDGAVVVLGASNNPERYSHQAVKRLRAAGFRVIPVNPKYDRIAGIPAVASLAEIDEPVDTVTVYVRPAISSQYAEDILRLKPRRVIFNVPGAENPELEERLKAAGIQVEEACTLVLLATGQW